MRKKALHLIIICVALLMTGCSSKPPKEKSKVAALESTPNAKISEIRYDTLKQTARGLAAQAGLSWRSYQLNSMLNNQKKYLDLIFNFNYLMLNQNVLPPVLMEGRNSLNISDDYTIRVSEHDYQIVQQPRFVTTPPNWRNYIWMAYKKPEQPNHTLLPQNERERRIWNEYIKIGWTEGRKQADEIFTDNVARLRRDFEGMILYCKLLAKNMVTPPYVSKTELGITGDDNELHINDRVLRITAIPKLQVDPKNWHPIIPTKNNSQNKKDFSPFKKNEKIK